jgi:hypothetical protein
MYASTLIIRLIQWDTYSHTTHRFNTSASDSHIFFACSSPCSCAKLTKPRCGSNISSAAIRLQRHKLNADVSAHLVGSALHYAHSLRSISPWLQGKPQIWVDFQPSVTYWLPPPLVSGPDTLTHICHYSPHMPLPMITTSADSGRSSSLPLFKSGCERTVSCHGDKTPSSVGGRWGCEGVVAIGMVFDYLETLKKE